AADAVRGGRPDLARAFRIRALGTGVVAGALTMGGLVVVRDDARRIWDGLTSGAGLDRKSTRLNSSHGSISYAVFCLKKKNYIFVFIDDHKTKKLINGNVMAQTLTERAAS